MVFHSLSNFRKRHRADAGVFSREPPQKFFHAGVGIRLGPFAKDICELGRQPFDEPGTVLLSRVAEAVVQAIGAALPKFETDR